MHTIWLFGMLVACGPPVERAVPLDDGATVRFETTLGSFDILTHASQAPVSTANFLQYVEEGYYDGEDGAGATVFHRVVPGFVVQGGGFSIDGVQKATRRAIVNESGNGLPNVRGAVAMARTSVSDSATSQFFVNVVDNGFLDATRGNNGYAVFGRVIAGMEVLDAIAGVDLAGEVPIVPIEVLSTEVL